VAPGKHFFDLNDIIEHKSMSLVAESTDSEVLPHLEKCQKSSFAQNQKLPKPAQNSGNGQEKTNGTSVQHQIGTITWLRRNFSTKRGKGAGGPSIF